MLSLRNPRFFATLTLALAVFSTVSPAHALTSFDDIVELDKTPENTRIQEKIQLSKPIETLNAPLQAHIKSATGSTAEDLRNLDLLWQSVISKNPVIQYGLKQLATPPELREVHSSILSRTVGGLLSGASLLPYMFGADPYTVGASAIGANMVDRAMVNSKKIDPSQLPSDTELVELASFVQSLQKALVSNYFDYKNCLRTMVQMNQVTDRLETSITTTKTEADPVRQIALEHQKQSALAQARAAKQGAIRHYIALERLVGKDNMKQLRFGDITPSEPGPVSLMPSKALPSGVMYDSVLK